MFLDRRETVSEGFVSDDIRTRVETELNTKTSSSTVTK